MTQTVEAPPRATTIWPFLALAFGIAWGWMALSCLVFDLSFANPLVQIPCGFAPAIAAVVVRRWISREGFADAGSRPRLRAAWPYYVLAWLVPFGIAAVVLVIAAASGKWDPALDEVVPGLPVWVLPLALGLLALVTTPLFWGEEFGWTGYLLVRIAPGRPRVAALAAGLVAAIWHYPLVLTDYDQYGNVLLGLVGWTAWIMCQEVLLAWLRERSGSVWPACLAHAGNNMILAPLIGVLITTGAFSNEVVNFLVVAVLIVLALRPLLTAHR
ncbi:CPBP family glutamic-type intramembrane protease [Cryptosporangium arvum]|uniref:CAAX amino terminal protease family n=1 Tax=Cryptosporangium arvum DSM 44712 TaxID=927661 RepID=A0A010ZPB8_9ACTN|nr:CPBP family glutamic-type intramembrane protease [Cryptosporangium arvum]EXG80529.1 CAAX amino terminal protease family [Cryptosporangium arvum DSM 44712]